MTTVKVYVYDLSQGLAKTLSYSLIGQQLDGIWHTGIVIYGKEYFFGSGGIDMCPPGGTILGAPHKIVDLGTSEIPEDIFLSYLTELSENAYRPECYHLFDHNCNTFSDEVAHFLTNKRIPEYITNLPESVSSTPLGQMLRTFIDRMSVSSSANSNFLRQTNSSSTSASSRNPSANPEPAKTGKVDNETVTSSSDAPPESVLCEEELLTSVREYWDTISESATSLLRALHDYATSPSDLNWGLGPRHFSLLDNPLIHGTPRDQLCILELFRLSLLKSQDVAIGLMSDKDCHWHHLLDRVSDDHFERTVAFDIAFTKMASNWIGQIARSGLKVPELLRASLQTYTVKVLDGPTELLPSATQLSYNLTCIKVMEDDSIIGLGSILIHVLSLGDECVPDSASGFAAKALLNLARNCEDIRQLAIVQELDVTFVKCPEAAQLQRLLRLEGGV